MIFKRSDAMGRILDAATMGAHNFEGICEKLDQLDDPAFWEWWQDSEKRRHMTEAGWRHDEEGNWYHPKSLKEPTSYKEGVRQAVAWDMFRIEHAHRTALPMMPVMLAFDPALQEGLSEILFNTTAWTLWILWKPRHIVSQHFNNEVLRMAARIDEAQPKTPQELLACFNHNHAQNFVFEDCRKFCDEALPYFTGEKEVEFIVNPKK